MLNWPRTMEWQLGELVPSAWGHLGLILAIPDAAFAKGPAPRGMRTLNCWGVPPITTLIVGRKTACEGEKRFISEQCAGILRPAGNGARNGAR